MMGIYKRHFRVDSGALIDEIGKIQAQRTAAAEALETFCPSVGAKEAKFWSDGSFACFVFDDEPDRDVYRRTKHGWVPKKNCAAGKAIWDQIKKLPPSPSVQNALSVVGLRHGVPCLIDDGKGYWPVMGGFPSKKIWFVEVPWRDVDPEEMARYIEKNEAGNHFDATLDHLRWTPPAEWREIKHWEYLKEWEELVDALS